LFILLLVHLLSFSTPQFNLPLVLEGLTISWVLLAVALNSDQDWSGALSAGVSRPSLFFGICFFALVSLGGVRAWHSFFDHSYASSLCFQHLPYPWQVVECIAHAGTDMKPELRLFSYSATAALLFAAFVWCLPHQRLMAAYKVIVLVGLIFAGLTLLAHFSGSTQLLPVWLFNNEFGSSRMTYLVQNPSWLWPYLVVPLVLSISFFLFQTSRSKGFSRLLVRFVAGVGFLLIATVVVGSAQRGGAVGLFVVVLSSVFVWMWFYLSRRFFWIAASLVALSAIVCSAAFLGGYLDGALANLNLPSRLTQGQTFLDTPRVSIWRLAMDLLQQRPWFGFGYGKWHEAFTLGALAENQPGLIFDTAHNFFVQVLFELGLLHSLLIFGTFIFGPLVLIRCCRDENPRILAAIILPAFVVVLVVQEFDFIRATYYLYAVFWGCLLGLARLSTISSQGDECRILRGALGSKPLVAQRWSRVARLSLFIGSGTCAASTIFVFSGFSSVGYQYEASVRTGHKPQVRWHRPWGSFQFVTFGHSLMALFGQRHVLGTDAYALFRVRQAVARSFDQSFLDQGHQVHWGGTLSLTDPPGVVRFMAAPITKWPSPKHQVWYSNHKSDFGRAVSVMTQWPPYLSRLPLVAAVGIHDFEPDPGQSSPATSDGLRPQMAWCSKTCRVVLLPCAGNRSRVLRVSASRSDVSQGDPLVVAIRQESVPDQEHEFTDDSPRDLLVAGGEWIELDAARAFVPGGNDHRSLGILLRGASCQAQ
jgi:O-antigen ligase